MIKKLFISTAGIGSRVAGLGIVANKSLLPINYEAIITKILDKFDNDIEVVVAVGHNADLVKNFLKLAHPEKKFRFVKIKRSLFTFTARRFSFILTTFGSVFLTCFS